MERMLNFDAPEKRPNVGLPGDSKSDLSATIHTHKVGFDFSLSFGEHSRGTLKRDASKLFDLVFLFPCSTDPRYFNVRPLEPCFWLEALTFGLLIGALASHGCWVANFITLTNSQSSVHFSLLPSFASFKCSTEVMSVLQRDGMHAWGQIGNTAGKPFLVFTEKRVSSLQDGFVFTFIFGHFLGKFGFRVKFFCRRNLPVDLVAHNAVISAAVRSLKPSGHPAVGAVLGPVGHHGVGCEAKGHDAQRARHGVMVPSCSATGGMPKAADMPSVRNQTTEHALQEL